MSSRISSYHALLRVSEEELHEISVGHIAIEAKYPAYYCVTKSGAVLIWPKFEQDKMQLLVSLGEK